MSKNKKTGSINGKGYYIALILCAVAIGITGYLYYRNVDDDAQLQTPVSATEDADSAGKTDVMAVATQPDVAQTDTTEQTASSTKPAAVTSPVAGETVCQYSMEALCYNQTTRDWRVHDGMDIAAETGTQVCAAADGTVYTVYDDETMGMTVVIRHDGGYTTTYASLAKDVSVEPGDTVTAGQVIGYVGTTALMESALPAHVHFSVSCDGELVDPQEFLE